MKHQLLLLLLMLICHVNASTVLDLPFNKTADLKLGNRELSGEIITDSNNIKSLHVSTPANYSGRGYYGISFKLPVKQLAGRRVNFSVEIKRNIAPGRKWQGGKFMLRWSSGQMIDWPGVYMKPGDFDWELKHFSVDLPLHLDQAILLLGIQDAQGVIQFRNLKVETSDIMLDLKSVANMGYRDQTANDGKGGWSDQGPLNDARNFRYKNKTFGGIPFSAINPRKNQGKSIVNFQSRRFPHGVKNITFDLSDTTGEANYLYLLHSLTWGSGSKIVGEIEIQGADDQAQIIKVQGKKDIADWWHPRRLPNGFPAAIWQTGDQQTVGLYGTRFKLNQSLGKINKVIFRSANGAATWHLVAVTLSNKKYEYPSNTLFTIKADKKWHPLPQPSQGGVIPGSALDIANCFETVPAGTKGRVIINSQGHFAFEKEPDKNVRFLSAVIITDPFGGRGEAKPEFSTKAMIAEYAKQLRLKGYNMIRFHYLDAVLLSRAQKDFDFNAKYLDMFDYFIYCLKQNGIYVYFDAMASRIGWSKGYPWSKTKRFFKQDIYFQEKVRQNWEHGVRKLLTRINPYTQAPLLNDPVLVMAVSYNEQEFAFFPNEKFDQAAPEFRKFLKKRYGSLEKLKHSWGEKAHRYHSFTDIPAFTGADITENSNMGRDIGRFIADKEKWLAKWYRDTLAKIGFKGYVANYNMGQSLRYIDVRSQDSVVALNGYHAHPFNNTMDSNGAISATARLMRGFMSVRPYGKPLVISEHGHMFWNGYRYEQGFVDGGYAAFQSLDALSGFSNQITVRRDRHPITPSNFVQDPIMQVAELQTAFLFRRKDLKSADKMVRIYVDNRAIYESSEQNEALHTGQAHLSLILGFAVDTIKDRKKSPNMVTLDAAGGSSLLIRSTTNAGYMQTKENNGSAFDLKKTIQNLRQTNFIPSNNRTDVSKKCFETITGEIYLDATRHFMSINTPRFQGVCAEAGTSAKLKDLSIHKMSVKGTLSAISLDNNSTLRNAHRILLVYATNALNSKMIFADKEHRARIHNGTTPVLIETGQFALTLNHNQPEKLKLFALGIDGQRLAELPIKFSDKKIDVGVNTARIPGGPVLFFELTDK